MFYIKYTSKKGNKIKQQPHTFGKTHTTPHVHTWTKQKQHLTRTLQHKQDQKSFIKRNAIKNQLILYKSNQVTKYNKPWVISTGRRTMGSGWKKKKKNIWKINQRSNRTVVPHISHIYERVFLTASCSTSRNGQFVWVP